MEALAPRTCTVIAVVGHMSIPGGSRYGARRSARIAGCARRGQRIYEVPAESTQAFDPIFSTAVRCDTRQHLGSPSPNWQCEHARAGRPVGTSEREINRLSPSIDSRRVPSVVAQFDRVQYLERLSAWPETRWEQTRANCAESFRQTRPGDRRRSTKGREVRRVRACLDGLGARLRFAQRGRCPELARQGHACAPREECMGTLERAHRGAAEKRYGQTDTDQTGA